MACTLAESPSDPLHRKLRQLRCLRCRFDCFYEKVVKVKADVAALHIFPFIARDPRVGNEAKRSSVELGSLVDGFGFGFGFGAFNRAPAKSSSPSSPLCLPANLHGFFRLPCADIH
jgi:hypothetical protein